jgi:hypothetical protein
LGKVLIVNLDGKVRHRISQLPPKSNLFKEDLLQRIIFKEPGLLSTESIDPSYRLIPLAREVSVQSGSIDVLYATPSGNLCIVETKLWRNPDAHRTVLAQILDYAKDLSKKNFQEFSETVTRQREDQAQDLLLEKFRGHTELNDIELQRNIQESLSHGRFLLLVVGDRIYPELVLLSETIGSAPNLEFKLALFELNLYLIKNEGEERLLVVPSLVGRTVEVTRAVVKILYEEKKPDVEVTATEAVGGQAKVRANLTEFLGSMPEGFVEVFKPYYEQWFEAGYNIQWATVGFTIRLNDKGRMRTLVEVSTEYMSLFTDKWAKSRGLPLEICRKFQSKIRKIGATDRIIAGGRVYLYYKDISAAEFHNILNEVNNTLIELVGYFEGQETKSSTQTL